MLLFEFQHLAFVSFLTKRFELDCILHLEFKCTYRLYHNLLYVSMGIVC
jgi:hypothetical protein